MNERAKVGTIPTREQLEGAACWEANDQIAGRPEMTAFRRRARYQQAAWREANQFPIGSQPIAPKPDTRTIRPVGSRLQLDFAQSTGANFLTAEARHAATVRGSYIERHQSVDRQGLWVDLLSSLALAFNLFGDLACDFAMADRALNTWFPDTPGLVSSVRFAHSPGWLDPAYLNSLRSFDTAFATDIDDGTHGIVAVAVLFHERNKPETPRPDNLDHYSAIAERSRIFVPGAIDQLRQRGDLCVLWLQHLLLLSMLQHSSGTWSWGRLLVVYPEGNIDAADACHRYQSMLANDTSFSSMTLEQLLATDTLPASTTAALRNRYSPDALPGCRS